MSISFPDIKELVESPIHLRMSEEVAYKAIDLAIEASPEFAQLINEHRPQLFKLLQGTLSKDEEKEIESAVEGLYPNIVAVPVLLSGDKTSESSVDLHPHVTAFATTTPRLVLASTASQCTRQWVAVGVDSISIILSLLGVGGAKGPIKSVVLKNLKAIERLAPLFRQLARAESAWEQASVVSRIVIGIISAVGYAGVREAISNMSAWEWIKFTVTLSSWVASGGAAIAIEIFNLGAALYDLVDDTIELTKMDCA